MSFQRRIAIGGGALVIGVLVCGFAIVSDMASSNSDGAPDRVRRGISEHEHGYVLVTEMIDADDAGRFSGLFAAQWESDDETRSRMGPQDVSLDDAIAWGREQSDVVLVQVGGGEDGYYSAGKRSNDGTPLLPRYLKVAARPRGAPLDGSEQVVPWVAMVDLVADPSTAQQLVNHLRRDTRIETVDQSAHGIKVSLEIGLRATGTRAASRAVWRALDAALSRSDLPVALADLSIRIRGIERATE